MVVQAVHGPLEAPQDLVKGRFAHVQDRARRVYAAMVYKLDEGVGNVTAALKRAGLYDNTVIIFSTDNGGGWGGGGVGEEGGCLGAGLSVLACPLACLLIQETSISVPTTGRCGGGRARSGRAASVAWASCTRLCSRRGG